jgi:intracellular multiplication protein IcmQ
MDEKIKKTAKDLLSALDNALASGSWDETNFVLIIGRKLKEMREKLDQKVKEAEDNSDLSHDFLSRQLAMQNSLKEVYVGLYSLEGVKLQSWERIVLNLKRQMVSRPVYATEEEIVAIIKTKEKKINEAYISIFVKEEDILLISAEKVPVDKLGQKMLVLKDNAIVLENIDFFVHMSGSYRYSRGRLLKTSPA